MFNKIGDIIPPCDMSVKILNLTPPSIYPEEFS